MLATSAIASGHARCAATARDVAAGEHLTAAVLTEVPCRSEAPEQALVAFSAATRSAVAKQAMPGGTYVGRLWAESTVILPKGTRVTLRAVSGPAIIEREVTTLQPARSGQRVFVRDADGQVFSVPLMVSEDTQ